MDGTLDDQGWAGAAVATHFTEFTPDKDARPSRRSEVLVTYDSQNLYVAFIACDDPSAIRATLTDRDQVTGDDVFGVIVDTYGNDTWAYELYVNPLGVQADWRRVGAVKDSTFDMVYHTAGRITPSGYQVEMAIPFASLRFPDAKDQRWRVNFVRKRPRGSYEEYSWSALDIHDPCLLCRSGSLTGIQNIQPGGALEALPSVVTSSASYLRNPADPTSGFVGGGAKASVGLGLQYAFPRGLTAQLAINPDFSQVESDAAQISVDTTFALFFPEKRPFFQEGADLYQTPIHAVYTRTVNDPQVAAKLTMRSGGTSVSYLGARDQHSPILLPFEEGSFVGQTGRSFTNILRVQQDFAHDSHVGATVTDRRLEGGPGENSVVGPDLQLHLGAHETFQYQWLASHTREPNAAGPTAALAGQTFDGGAHTAMFDGESYWGYAQ
ncbi:MAG: carbohydrate binding family 9 domain-containing protein, partial [Gemmatimonadota bacterium]|nr:carbohydrate binding family 9 domain-containing protein [Gemmatimonadota bacterium]